MLPFIHLHRKPQILKYKRPTHAGNLKLDMITQYKKRKGTVGGLKQREEKRARRRRKTRTPSLMLTDDF